MSIIREAIVEHQEQRRFETVIGQHQEIFQGLCIRFFPRDEHRRDDLFQLVMEKLWINRSKLFSLSDETALTAWMYTTTRNMACSYWLQCHRHDSRFVSLEGMTGERETGERETDDMCDALYVADKLDWANAPDWDDLLTDEQQITVLYSLLDALPDNEITLMMMYIGGSTQKTIAAKLGIEPGAVGMRIKRLKEKINQMYKQKQKQEE